MAAPLWATNQQQLLFRLLLPFTALLLATSLATVLLYRNLTASLLFLRYTSYLSVLQDGSFELDEGEWRISSDKDNYGRCTMIWQFANETTAMQNAGHLECIGYGWNKRVYQMENLALKTINLKGEALKDCFQLSAQVENCLIGAVNSFIKETMLLIKLQNDANVPQLYAYCIPQNPVYNVERLAMLVEKGEQLDMIYMLQKDWHHRLLIFDEITQLLYRVHPLVFNDIRKQQFIIINDKPYIADLDDVAIANETFDDNIHSAIQTYESFVKVLLLYDNPKPAKGHLDALRKSYDNKTLTMGLLRRKINLLKNL